MPFFPSLSVLRQRIGDTADLLVQSHKNFIDGLQGLMDDPIRLQHVRCPLDIRRANVTSPAWTPFFLTDLTVSATPDLVSIIHGLQEVQQHTQHRLPLLVDENIHYRVLKLVYSISYARYNVPLFITRTPVVYGTWHPYKYCVTLCYSRFFPLFTFFSYGSLNLGTAVPNFPKLIYMERMILVLLHLAHKWRQPLEQKLQSLRGLHRPGNANHNTLLTQVQGLVTLLYGYIPALFIIGSQVRDCHWSAPGEQHAAGPLLSRCLNVLLRFTLGYEDKVEYVRTIVVARLLWSQWFARLPGVAHSEEPCEALLSRVVHLMAQHPRNCTWSLVLTVNVHEMQRVRKLLAKSPRAAKLSLGKWTWSAENLLPSLDTIQKAPLWQDEEWAELRIALARPVKETAVTATDREKSTTIWPNKPQDGTKATGARAEAIALVPGKAIPYTIALREYKAVCNHYA